MTGREASRLLRKPPSQQQNGATGRTLENARRHHAAGDLPKAESIYRQILQTENNHPDALHLLGLIAYQIGKNDVALNLITKALKSAQQPRQCSEKNGAAGEGCSPLP